MTVHPKPGCWPLSTGASEVSVVGALGAVTLGAGGFMFDVNCKSENVRCLWYLTFREYTLDNS